MTTRDYTTAEVAERWHTTPDFVRHKIRAGELGARKLNPLGKRPAYRITAKHLAAYERRSDQPAA